MRSIWLSLLIGPFFAACADKPLDMSKPVYVTVSTAMGDVTVELYGDTPLHRDNFIRLCRSGAYDGVLFHRVIEGFVVQGGDPDSRKREPGVLYGGNDGGYTVPAEIRSGHFNKRGALIDAKAGDETNPERASAGTQFCFVQGRRMTDEELDEAEKQITEIWICDRNTLANARCVFTVSCGNHNGPSATFTDNDHIVFRDIINGFSAFRVLNIHTGEVVYGPIFGKESHCAENGQYPFSISEEFLDKNPDYPELNTCGIYLLDLTTGKIRRVADKKTVYDMVVKSGCTPNDHTTSMSHVQLNPSATKVMMRLSVANCPVFGALGCIDLETGKTHVIPDKPVHLLWFDDDTSMATRQYYDGSKIEMETSRIQRFTPDGECIETLGGIGNHIDGSPDRSYFVGDRAYPGYPADIFLYRRGETTPIATFGGQNFQNCTWKLQIHPNPTFSRDGKRIYFNHPVSENRTEACFVEIDELLK